MHPVNDTIKRTAQRQPQHPHAQVARKVQKPALVIIMGVSGCGKSTVGEQLSDDLSVPFCDGDDLHPSSNVEKMSKGVALTDDDRWPWLHRIREEAARLCATEAIEAHQLHSADGHPISNALARPTVIIACSALKRAYRDLLRGRTGERDIDADHENVQTYFVFCAYIGQGANALISLAVKGSRDLLVERMHQRKGHFMKSSMLDSQLATLEEPSDDEDRYGGVIIIDISQSKEDVRARAAQAVRQHVGL